MTFNLFSLFSIIAAHAESPALDDTAEFPSVFGYEDDTPSITLPEQGQYVFNTESGEWGIVRGVWLNQWTSQYVVNVRVNGIATGWNITEIGKAA